jgi:mono/diheme cytochrome c family protein
MAGRFILSCTIALSLVSSPYAVARAQDTTAHPDTRSVLTGVYTDDQAKKGESTYGKFCVACHDASEHAGEVFEEAWSGRPVFDFFMKIRTTMPDDEPGKLNDQQYTDIVAYMLKLSGYPSGATTLPYESEKMRGIMIEPRPKRASSQRAAEPSPRFYFPHADGPVRTHR